MFLWPKKIGIDVLIVKTEWACMHYKYIMNIKKMNNKTYNIYYEYKKIN